MQGDIAAKSLRYGANLKQIVAVLSLCIRKSGVNRVLE